ncbi:MAG TPA: glycosyltransferase family 2 protein, partial [Rhodocyclaceae bacterium]|nr:glycosyltransferase family 2 protein [Rhodocyclaceae bacterium]
MPVYNEAEYLPQALDCLLSQKYPDIEFVLADNASSDGTLEICLRAAETDKRVAVLSADANMGATENFLRCATAA